MGVGRQKTAQEDLDYQEVTPRIKKTEDLLEVAKNEWYSRPKGIKE